MKTKQGWHSWLSCTVISILKSLMAIFGVSNHCKVLLPIPAHCHCRFVLLQVSDVFYLTCTVNTCQTPEVVSSNTPLDLHNWCWNARYEYQLCVSVCFRIGLSSVFVGECSCPWAVWSRVHWAKKELHIRTGLTFTAPCAFRCLGYFLSEHIKRLKINRRRLKTLLCAYAIS